MKITVNTWKSYLKGYGNTWTGYIKVFTFGESHWVEISGIRRLTCTDALKDAQLLRENLEAETKKEKT